MSASHFGRVRSGYYASRYTASSNCGTIKEAQLEEREPIPNWVRDDNWDIMLTGAVLAGKLVRLQAECDLGVTTWGRSVSPSALPGHDSHEVLSLWADVAGPPRTHSANAWQTGRIKRFGQQQRHYFTDAHRNKSGLLIVTNVRQYTTEPKFLIQAEDRAGLAGGVQGRLAAESGMAATKIMVGGTTDPRVRVTLIVPERGG